MAIKTFTTGEVLTAADTNTYLANSGLVYVAGTTFTTTANPFINGCFTSDYEQYRFVINVMGSATSNVRLRVRYGTSTTETGSVYDRFGFSYAGAVTSQISANETSYFLTDVANVAGTRAVISGDIFNVSAPRETQIMPYSWGSNSGSVFLTMCRIESSTIYTGVELFTDSGTLTGSIRIYGYRQA